MRFSGRNAKCQSIKLSDRIASVLKKNLIYIFLLVSAAAFLASCATNYNVLTNAYLDKTVSNLQIPAGASFIVLSNQSSPNPIFDNEVKMKIENLLSKKGYKLASEGSADYFITFNYDISGRSETETRPDFVQHHDIVRRVFVSGSNTYYDVVSPGYTSVTYASETYTVYTARLFVKVLDPNSLKNHNEKVVWVGDTINESQNPDLRESIDYLLVATFKFFGKDTGKNQEVMLSSNDKEVGELRNFSAQTPSISKS